MLRDIEAKPINKRNRKKSRAGDAGCESEELSDPPEDAGGPWLGLDGSRLIWIALWVPCGTRSLARFGDHQNHRYDAIKVDFENISTGRRGGRLRASPTPHAMLQAPEGPVQEE